MAQFWQTALHYVPELPSPDYETWQSWMAAMGVPQSEWDGALTCHPQGTGPPLYFQKVPEP